VSLKKYIIVLLGLLLCLSVISTQANTRYVLDYDMPSLDDAPEVKVYSDNDQDEPAILTMALCFEPSIVSIEPGLVREIYRQPDSPPLLRPPIV
jgi:hypothetical protein